MNIELERQAFEQWADQQWPGAKRQQLERDDYGRYKNSIYQDYWTGWQARATHPAQTEQQPIVVPEDFQPLETIRWWISAYTNPENGPSYQGHGMMVQMLCEYEALRIMLSSRAQQWPTAYPHEAMDKLATDRYRVGSASAGTLHRYAVRAGDGEQELYRGSESDCQNVARKLAGAFLDGGLAFQAMLAAPIAQTAPQAEQQPVAWADAQQLKALVRDYSASCAVWNSQGRSRVPLYAAPIAQTAPQHPDDEAVDRFAVAMKAKLAASREKGRHGWQNATAPYLSALLYDHMYKADPLDVGNLAMMLHQNGQAIELPQEARGRKQPAEVEGVEVVGVIDEADEGCFVELMDDRSFRLGEKLVRQTDHLAALSAVTAERDRLQGEIQSLRGSMEFRSSLIGRTEAERDQLRAEVEGMRKAFGECIQSLHDEMLQSYGGQKPDDMHPVTRRNYDSDMAEIAEYRAAMAAKGA